jgi:pimeloyl-ACP methyl ester carboxylesterase
MRLLAVIQEPASIARTLAAVGEAPEVPRRSPGRGPPYWKSQLLRRQVLEDEQDCGSHGDGADGRPGGATRVPGRSRLRAGRNDPDFRAWNIEEYLKAIRCPILVIQGEEVEYGTLAQVDAIEAGPGGPVRRLVLPGCGHSPQRAQPEATPWSSSCVKFSA